MILAIWSMMLLLQAAANPAVPALPPNKPIEVIVFSDFQCPYCAQFSQPVRRLEKEGIDGVQTKLTFKNFPLDIHSNARFAHQAALAAKAQGKFWEMHDLLFANQSAVKRDDILSYAKKLGLDLDRFRKDLDSDAIKQAIQADVLEGDKLGVNATPTFFVNGKAFSGSRSFDQLKQIIEGDERRARAIAEITDNMMSKGPKDAPVTLEFFADLQSPVTRPAMDVLNTLLQQYPKAVRIQFRNYPLSFHPLAPLAHEAAMTAALQGHFWEFAEFILQHQDSLREQDLIAEAGKLGLDAPAFAENLRVHRYAGRVDADLENGGRRGIHGSPVVFVNGRRIDGVPSLQTLIEDVQAELAGSAKSSK